MNTCKFKRQTGTSPSRVQDQTGTEIELIAAKQQIVDLITETVGTQGRDNHAKKAWSQCQHHKQQYDPHQHHTLSVRQFTWGREYCKRCTSAFGIPRPPTSEAGWQRGPNIYLSLKYFKKYHPNIKLPNIKLPYLKVLRRDEGGVSNWVCVDTRNTLENMVFLGMEKNWKPVTTQWRFQPMQLGKPACLQTGWRPKQLCKT